MFCCRLPQPKLESSDILLDMINELGRCPAALYTVLSEENKQRFHISRDVDGGFEREDTGIDVEESEDLELEQELILKRQGDRLPYFALRYFDDTDAFSTLRFDVYLGRWRTRPLALRLHGARRSCPSHSHRARRRRR